MFFGLIEGLPVGVFVLDATASTITPTASLKKILGPPEIQDADLGHLPDQLHLYLADTTEEYPRPSG